jgi:hypothetical protein
MIMVRVMTWTLNFTLIFPSSHVSNPLLMVCTLHPTTDVPFRLSCKTLDTSYVHRHSSPSILASIRSVLLTPVLPTPTALPSDNDNTEKAEMDDLIKRKV